MIKRSFFALSKPRLSYDLLEPNPDAPQTIDLPLLFTLLLQEPIDSKKKALIQKGDTVKKGQRLVLYDDSKDYAVSPVAGTVKSVAPFSDDLTGMRTCITVEKNAGTASDSLPLDLKEDLSFAAGFLQALPGAPPFGVLADEGRRISTIVIMGADTDLLTTTAQYMSTAHADALTKGARILKQITGGARICMTRPKALNGSARFEGIQVFETGAAYPETLPAMIMKDHLDKILIAGAAPEDMGICFVRAEAVVSLARTFEKKAPVFEKCITLIDQNGARHRIAAVIGTPLKHIFTQLGIQVNDLDRIVINGPMQGFATFTPHHPVTPDMDSVIIQALAQIPAVSDTGCINCGKCIQICPANIPVNMLYRFLDTGQYEAAAAQTDLESCIDCGLCTYVCTSQIALCQYIRLGKHELSKLRIDA
jgi:Na+-translocating ferredoxin:NAD+ oxidoreductase subunit C